MKVTPGNVIYRPSDGYDEEKEARKPKSKRRHRQLYIVQEVDERFDPPHLTVVALSRVGTPQSLYGHPIGSDWKFVRDRIFDGARGADFWFRTERPD